MTIQELFCGLFSQEKNTSNQTFFTSIIYGLSVETNWASGVLDEFFQ